MVLPALSKSSALSFLLKFSEGGVPGGGIEPGTAVQQSSALSAKLFDYIYVVHSGSKVR